MQKLHYVAIAETGTCGVADLAKIKWFSTAHAIS